MLYSVKTGWYLSGPGPDSNYSAAIGQIKTANKQSECVLTFRAVFQRFELGAKDFPTIRDAMDYIEFMVPKIDEVENLKKQAEAMKKQAMNEWVEKNQTKVNDNV